MTCDDLVDEVAQAIVLADTGAEISGGQAVAFARAAVQRIQELRLTVLVPVDESEDDGW